MKRKFYRFMMKVCYKMAFRADKSFYWWSRAYAEWAERYCKEGAV